MFDMLPFPRITTNTPEEQIKEVLSYLTQFKETLEFALMNISTDNLSADLVNQLNDLGANIQKSNEERENEISQLANQSNGITVFDVINSEAFKLLMKKEVSSISFEVNFESGHLEYALSDEEG